MEIIKGSIRIILSGLFFAQSATARIEPEGGSMQSAINITTLGKIPFMELHPILRRHVPRDRLSFLNNAYLRAKTQSPSGNPSFKDVLDIAVKASKATDPKLADLPIEILMPIMLGLCAVNYKLFMDAKKDVEDTVKLYKSGGPKNCDKKVSRILEDYKNSPYLYTRRATGASA
jgi:hypothetical protein